MKYVLILAVGVCLFVAPVLAEQQTTPPERGPEHELLSYFKGGWACEWVNNTAKYSGDMTCDWFADGFFIQCSQEVKPSGAIASVMGFDKHEKAYSFYMYWSRGARATSGKGWVRDNTWTFVFENERVDDKPQRRQMTFETTPDSYTFKWEYSVEGEPWRVTTEGSCSRLEASTN